MGHFDATAPVSRGWSWSDSGIGEGYIVGFSRVELDQDNRD